MNHAATAAAPIRRAPAPRFQPVPKSIGGLDLEVLKLVARHQTNREIAARLKMQPRDVKASLRRCALAVNAAYRGAVVTRIDLGAFARRCGFGMMLDEE